MTRARPELDQPTGRRGLPRPTTTLNSRAVFDWRARRVAGYIALYPDGSTGPLRAARARAERDYTAAADA